MVLVGPAERPFTLHQGLVCAKSKFFKAACSRRWLEGQQKIVRLPEANPEAFQEYCKWTYSDYIVSINSTGAATLLNKLFILGDALDDLKLRNRVTYELLTGLVALGMYPKASLLQPIWESTLAGSLFRKMMVDLFVAARAITSFAEQVSDLAPEFVQDVAVAAIAKLPCCGASGDLAKQVGQYLEAEEPENSAA